MPARLLTDLQIGQKRKNMAVVAMSDAYLPGSLIQSDAVIAASPDMPVALPEAAPEPRPTRVNRLAGILKKAVKAMCTAG